MRAHWPELSGQPGGASRCLYATLRHLNRKDEAAKLVASIPKDLAVVDATQYKDLLLLYKGEKTADELMAKAAGH